MEEHRRWKYTNSCPDNGRDTVAVFSSVVAITLAASYSLGRIGLEENPIGPIVNVLFLSFFLLFLPTAVRIILGWKGPIRPGFEAIVSLFGLLIVVIAGLGTPYLSYSPLPVFVVAGLILFVVSISTWLRRHLSAHLLVFLAISAAFAVWASLVCVGGGSFQTPLFIETIMTGAANTDELYHIALTSILKTYGVPSTGLDGLPTFHYHWGSHWIFAQIAKLLQMPTATFYQLAYPVIFVPFWVYSILGFTVDFRGYGDSIGTEKPLTRDAVFWLIFVAACVGFFPRDATVGLAMWGTPFPFESYTVGLSLSFILLSLILFESHAFKVSERIGIGDYVLIVVVLPFLLGAIGLVKVSCMILLFVPGLYFFFRLQLYKTPSLILSLVVGVLGAAVAAWATVSDLGHQSSFIFPFHFFIFRIADDWKPFFILLYFFWSWAFIILRFCEAGCHSLKDLRDGLKTRSLIDVEFVFILCLLGLGPGMLLGIVGGSAGWFSDVQTWMSLSLLLGSINKLAQNARPFAFRTISREQGFWSISLKGIFCCVVAICFAASVLTNIAFNLVRAVDLQLRTRIALVPEDRNGVYDALKHRITKQFAQFLRSGNVQPLKDTVFREIVPLFTPAVRERIERNENYRTIHLLQELDKLSLEEKRRTALFIPKSNRLYWRIPVLNCQVRPFLTPVITEMAMIDGLPEEDCFTHMCGYQAYEHKQLLESGLDVPQADPCSRAAAKGFSDVILVDVDPSGNVKSNRFRCDDHQRKPR